MRRLSQPAVSLLAGRSVVQLQNDLAAAQNAYLELSQGAKVVSVSYAQGAGSRTVSYTPTDMGAVQTLIRSLQRELGIVTRGRAPIRPVFG